MLYLVFAYVPALDIAARFFDPIFDAIFPVFMAMILFVTFCKVDFRQLRPVAWHLWIGIFQVLFIGILMVLIPVSGFALAAAGFVVIGIGMGPVYPAIQHMAPSNFGPKYSAAVIGLQMASAYIGSTFMPMVFGHLQQAVGIRIMPLYLTVFAAMNIGFLELAYKRVPGSSPE